MNELAAFLLGAALAGAAAYGAVRLRRPRLAGGPAPAAEPPEVERQRRRTDEILERMNEGVVVLDDRLRPLFANAPARALLGLPDVSLPHRVPSEALATLAWRSLRESRSIEEVIELWFPARTSLRARVAPIADSGVVVVVQDVTQELRTQRVRREFVAHASHELKSPVAGVQVLAEAVLEAVPDDPDAVASFAERIVKETDRLGHLIADLLDLSRLEEAERVPETPVDLSDVVTAEVTSAGFGAERKGTRLESHVQPGVWVRGERTQLGNLVRNLLENAVHYTPGGGTVVVSLERDAGEAILTVEDDGIGIPHEAQQRVFERFYRVDAARSRDTGGTGLGLAIVKHIAELHGGTVAVESEPGRGSAFCARLPAMPPRDGTAGSLAG